MKFLDVKTDFAFKKVFGSENSKSKLISFLNSIIYDNSTKKIKDLTIVDPYNIPMIKGVKDTFVDVKAILDDDTKVIIEMQVLNHSGLEKRILYNAAKNYSIQLDRNEKYHLLNPVIALTIVDFNMFSDSEKVINRFKLLEKEKLITYNDDIELIFVELSKFSKDIDLLDGIQDEWIYFIKNAGRLEYVPSNLNEEIQTALEVVNEANLSKDELEAQHKRKEFISIQKLSILKAKEDGLQQGIEEGIEKGIEKGIMQGIEQEKLTIAKKSLLQGIDKETISLITNIPVSMIEKLKLQLTQ